MTPHRSSVRQGVPGRNEHEALSCKCNLVSHSRRPSCPLRRAGDGLNSPILVIVGWWSASACWFGGPRRDPVSRPLAILGRSYDRDTLPTCREIGVRKTPTLGS